MRLRWGGVSGSKLLAALNSIELLVSNEGDKPAVLTLLFSYDKLGLA